LEVPYNSLPWLVVGVGQRFQRCYRWEEAILGRDVIVDQARKLRQHSDEWQPDALDVENGYRKSNLNARFRAAVCCLGRLDNQGVATVLATVLATVVVESRDGTVL
jgi:hypothetical protein